MAYTGGTLKSTSINGVKMYSITGQHRSLASWVDPKKRRALRKDRECMQRVEIIQDLKFETATTRIRSTPDGEYLIASGIYPPVVKVYELQELSLKFERNLDSEIFDFKALSDDYSKLAFLCADRSVRLHAKYGSHYSLRIPRMEEILNMTAGPVIYFVLHLHQIFIGLSWHRFSLHLVHLEAVKTGASASECLIFECSMLHGLVACGGEDGFVECFDMRTRSSDGRINAVIAVGDYAETGGFQMAVGSSAGKVLLYDLRSSIKVKDHMQGCRMKYGSPILDIKWHQTLSSEKPKLITTGKHIVRIWDPESGGDAGADSLRLGGSAVGVAASAAAAAVAGAVCSSGCYDGCGCVLGILAFQGSQHGLLVFFLCLGACMTGSK
ncbi:Nucleolar protein 10-like protein [Drosera capensis]